MDANTYQKEAQRTLIDVPDREIPLEDLQIVWAALKISIVVGKLVEHLKKGIFHHKTRRARRRMRGDGAAVGVRVIGV